MLSLLSLLVVLGQVVPAPGVGADEEARKRLQARYERARLAARPFIAGPAQRLGEVPRACGPLWSNVFWSEQALCVVQGTTDQVRCYDTARSKWSKAEPLASSVRSPVNQDYRFEGLRVMLASEAETKRTGLSWSLEELGIDSSTWSSRRLLGIEERKAKAAEDFEADCGGRSSRLWDATHTDEEAEACERREAELHVQRPTPSQVWWSPDGRFATLALDFDDAWELWLVRLRP